MSEARVSGRYPKKVDPLYSTAEWRECREIVRRRDRYRCVICKVDVHGSGRARVDHIVPVKHGGAPLDPANCRTLCTQCDAQAHRERAGGGSGPRRQWFGGQDKDGNPLDPNHHWNLPDRG